MTATIDLHMHTTASDGICTPEQLVESAARIGIRVISVTDHDTRAGEGPARLHAQKEGLEFIPGIEITSVAKGRDVHVLAYGLPAEVPKLEALIVRQRELRLARAREIADRLANLGVPVDADRLMAAAASSTGKAIARPQIAQWLIDAGHVATVSEAFDRYLSEGQPAYVPHQGAAPSEVIALVRECGGVSSLAHPGYTKQDELIPTLVDAGMPCIEVFHSSHDAEAEQHYLGVAGKFNLVPTGGSDYHGPGTRRSEFFGISGLPADRFERFRELLTIG